MTLNQYLAEYRQKYSDFKQYDRWVEAFKARDELTRKFAWAVPTDEALECIAKYSPIVEIGAGTGYWAHLLEQMGVEIHAYDKYPPDGTQIPDFDVKLEDYPGKSWYHRGAYPHTNVRQGNQRKLKGYKPQWNLFLCWPTMSNVAVQSLIYHRGEYVIYIGEGRWGCNANDAFFDRLDKFYEQVEGVSIPQWDGIHDYLDVYRRR